MARYTVWLPHLAGSWAGSQPDCPYVRDFFMRLRCLTAGWPGSEQEHLKSKCSQEQGSSSWEAREGLGPLYFTCAIFFWSVQPPVHQNSRFHFLMRGWKSQFAEDHVKWEILQLFLERGENMYHGFFPLLPPKDLQTSVVTC